MSHSRILPLVFGVCLTIASLAQQPQGDSVQQAKSFWNRVSPADNLDYLLFLPRDYAEKPEQKWPLILFLHGSGERGTNVWLVAKHGPPKVVKNQPDFPFIVVSPQCAAGRRWSDDALLALLTDIQTNYNVDPTRVYLTGLSMGGYGTWSLGAAHPEVFAAIAPICGGGVSLKTSLSDPQKAAALKSLPVWAFHGAKDSVVKLPESERMVRALKQAGCTNVQLTVYPEADHDSWTVTYDNPKFYEWLLAQHRRARRILGNAKPRGRGKLKIKNGRVTPRKGRCPTRCCGMLRGTQDSGSSSW